MTFVLPSHLLWLVVLFFETIVHPHLPLLLFLYNCRVFHTIDPPRIVAGHEYYCDKTFPYSWRALFQDFQSNIQRQIDLPESLRYLQGYQRIQTEWSTDYAEWHSCVMWHPFRHLQWAPFLERRNSWRPLPTSNPQTNTRAWWEKPEAKQSKASVLGSLSHFLWCCSGSAETLLPKADCRVEDCTVDWPSWVPPVGRDRWVERFDRPTV